MKKDEKPAVGEADPQTQALAALQQRVERDHEEIVDEFDELADQYTGAESFPSLFRKLAGQFAARFNTYQREFWEIYGPLKTRIAEAMEGESYKRRLQAELNAQHAERLDEMKVRLEGIYLDVRGEKVDAKRQLKHLKRDKLPLKDKLRRVKVALAGDDNAFISMPATGVLNVLANFGFIGGASLLIMLTEILAGGYDMWVHETNDRMAIGLTIATVVLPTVFGFTTATYWRRYHAAMEAKSTFRRLYPDGHPEGFVVDEFPDGDRKAAWISMILLLLTTFGLVGYRVWVVMYEQFQQAGLIAAAVIAVIALGFTLIKYLFSPKYSAEQYTALGRILKEIEGLEERAKQASDPAELQRKIDDVVQLYKDANDKERERVIAEVDGLTEDQKLLLQSWRVYNDAYDAYEAKYLTTIGELNEYVHSARRLDGRKTPAHYVSDAVGYFRAMAHRTHNDAAFIDQLRIFVFSGAMVDPELDDPEIKRLIVDAQQVLTVHRAGGEPAEEGK